MSLQTDISTAESHSSQTNTSIMTSSSSETNNGIRNARKATTLWPEVKQYLLVRATSSRDPNTVIPHPMCALCDETELDIAGVPASDIDTVRFEAACLPCGHMFCIPCLNEYEDNLPDASPYDTVYNPLCGRRKLTREYKCPVCRADMHHRKCGCEVGACDLPSSDLLDGGVAEFGGQWVPKVLHPGERTHDEIVALEWVDHNPAIMNKETRQQLVKLVTAVQITIPEWEAAEASTEDDDDDDNGSSEAEDDEEEDEDEEVDSSDSDDDAEHTPDIEMADFANEDEFDYAITQHEIRSAGLNNKTYPIAVWNQVVSPVCRKCCLARLRESSSAKSTELEIMPVNFWA